MIAAPKRVVLKSDPHNEPQGDVMEFRLTYEGPLLSTQRDPEGGQPDPRANNKRDIRKAFHHQLKRLWNITPFLKTGQDSGPTVVVTHDSDTEPRTIEKISKIYKMYGFNFVPLVMEDLNLICGLDILFLRADPPGNLRREETHDHTESQTRGPRAYRGAVRRVHVGPDGPGLGGF